MINKSVINLVIENSTLDNKVEVIKELLNHISLSYDYNDSKGAHILEMLCDSKTIVKIKDVNVDFINNNLNLLIYNYEKYNIRNIKADSVDNIDCSIKVTYEYLEKVNEDRDDVVYTSSYSNINFINNPDILKKEC